MDNSRADDLIKPRGAGGVGVGELTGGSVECQACDQRQERSGHFGRGQEAVRQASSPDYNTIGTGAASHTAAGEIENYSDLFIADDLEVDGHAWLDGGHTDAAEYIIITENNVNKKVQYIEASGYRKTDMAGAIIVADPAHPEKATLTGTPYDKRILGIIATNPSLVISGGISKEYGYPIVLAGRIPTRVCAENGSIEIGDFITTSSKPGYGMKATEPRMVVGQALEAFSGVAGECGQILVFQNIGWYHNAAGFVSNAVTFGLEKIDAAEFPVLNTNVPQTGDLHLTGKLYGYNNNWVIDNGYPLGQRIEEAPPGRLVLHLLPVSRKYKDGNDQGHDETGDDHSAASTILFSR